MSTTSPNVRPPLTAADLRGVFVPLVTPFGGDGTIDLASLLALTDGLLSAGVHGLVLAGTTGESPTVRWDEVEAILPPLLARVRGRVPLLVGTGTNDTAESVERTRRARALGADGAFAVCPYYNRPAPAGVIAHYRAIAAVGLPVVAYHIPYRTGLTLDRETLAAILAVPGVVGLKESSGGVGTIAALAPHTTAAIMCGDDALFVDALAAGGTGGIVASANLVARPFVEVYDAFVAGAHARAARAFSRLQPTVELLFAEPNPAPLKWALARQGHIASAALRLPMVPIGQTLAERLARALPPTAGEIGRLVEAFARATVPPADWTHRAHLVVGTEAVARLGPQAALEHLRAGILRLNRAHGTPETPTRGYHETITAAYVTLLAQRRARMPAANAAALVADVLGSGLAAKDALLAFWSRERLSSPQARAAWVAPDRGPLDAAAVDDG